MQKSAFDEYDKENGYLDDEENTTLLDLFFELYRYARETDKMTYYQFMNCDIEDYLDFLLYESKNPIERRSE